MQPIPVNSPAAEKAFLHLPLSIYKNDSNWVRPLDKDINDVFDPNKNKAFRFGELQRWILINEQSKPIGRIAAFTNKKYKNKGDQFPVGGIGFFECINDQTAADLLLNTSKDWLQERGMEAMDGPINFGERDRWWGMVTQGFSAPLYGMNYNPPYYVKLFENYGFQLFFNQVCFGFEPQKPLTEKVKERHRELASNPAFSMQLFDKKRMGKFAADFCTVYNKAWAGHGGLKELSIEQVMVMFKKMKPVIDPKIVYYAYHNEEPIGIFLNLPDLNQYFRHFNGQFGLLQKLQFVFRQKFLPARKFTGIVFGIVPEWQGKGVDAYLIGECGRIIQVPSKPYTEYEMQWIGDFNPKMINVAKSFGDTFVSKNLVTYRYPFNRSLPFERHPIV